MITLRVVLLALVTLTIFLVAPTVHAHGLNLFATVEGSTIQGSLVYADSTPAAGASIKAFAPDGTAIAETATDAAGRFSFEARFHCRHRLVGDAGQGHRGLFTIPEDQLPDGLPAYDVNLVGVSTTQESVKTEETQASSPPVRVEDEERLETAIARQLRPLREQLNHYETSIRIRDVLGGIGYLFGLAGLVALLKSRRNNPVN